MDLFEGVDWGTYYFFRFQANRLPAVTQLLESGTLLGTYVATGLVLAFAVALALFARRWSTGLTIALGSLAAVFIVEGLKAVIQRPRPPDAQNVLGPPPLPWSFPSQAVFMAAYAWLMLALVLERAQQTIANRIAFHAVAAIVIIFICVSQLWFGLHFVSDILAGLTGGIGMALLVRWLAWKR